MLFVPLGATHDIGASCHYVQIEGTGLLLDAGMDPDLEGPEALPDLTPITHHPDRHVDHIIVTHAHHDHLGSLPVLLKTFPHARVHMTPATRRLADLLLPASARLQRRRLVEGSTVAPPVFDEDEVEAASYMYDVHDFNEVFYVSGVRARAPLCARFHYSGHILGAAGVELFCEEGPEERLLFYTSDTNMQGQTIIPGGDYPESVDILILESTMGLDGVAETVTRRSEERRLGEAISRVISRGGSVLLPVFALGRAQEVIALIDRFKRRGILDEALPVYTAGSMRAVADLYDQTRYSTPRLNAEFEVFGVEQRRLPRSNQAKVEAIRESSVFVLASGMMFERTLSNELAQMIVDDEKHGIFFVGFAREDSPGGLLLDAAQRGDEVIALDRLRGPQRLRCEVDRFRLSGHSHRRDLLNLVNRLRAKQVVLVHGESRAIEWMSDNIRFFDPTATVHVPETGRPVLL